MPAIKPSRKRRYFGMTSKQVMFLAGIAILDLVVLAFGLIIATSAPNLQTAILVQPNASDLPPLSEGVALQLTIDLSDKKHPFLVGKTNLPDNTKLMTSISNYEFVKGDNLYLDEFFMGGNETVVSNGMFKTSPFGPITGLTDGRYTAEVMMPVPNVQPASVQAVIGKNGENLKGPLVKQSDSGGIIVSVNKEFQIGTLLPTPIPTTIPGSKNECDEFRNWSAPTTSNMLTAITLLKNYQLAIQDVQHIDLNNLYDISTQFYYLSGTQAKLKPRATRLRPLNTSISDAFMQSGDAIAATADGINSQNVSDIEDAKNAMSKLATDFPQLSSQIRQIANDCGITLDK